MSGRQKSGASLQTWQTIFALMRQGHAQREIARQLHISIGTVSYYVRKGQPPFDARYWTAGEVDEALRRATNERLNASRKRHKSHVSRTPKVVRLDERRRAR